ncbi:RNA-directed DNA polymerase, eukaryota [Tanacetum coccineum]
MNPNSSSLLNPPTPSSGNPSHALFPGFFALSCLINDERLSYQLTALIMGNGRGIGLNARYRIDQNILPTLAHATTWDKSIPRKVNVFMWRLSLDRLPHRLNYSSRGMDIPAISFLLTMPMLHLNHIFFECDIATDMWKLVFRWCDIPLFQASSWDSFQ